MGSRPARGSASAGAAAEVRGEDSEWVRSFLSTRPGKTYRVAASEEAQADAAREHAAREALAEAARTLIDRVPPDSQAAERDDGPPSGPPS